MNTLNWKNATPEQKNLWDNTRGLIAWNTITPMFYQGAIAGSEFLVYNAAKLYIALELEVIYHIALVGGAGTLFLYDIANVVNYAARNSCGFWIGAAENDIDNSVLLKNLFFSRITTVNYSYMKFNGYRLTTI